MKAYLVAVDEVTDEDTEKGEDYDERDDMLSFPVGDVECFATKDPPPGPLAGYMASTSKNSDTQEMVAGTINFFFSVLDDDSRSYLYNRLMDRKDKFELETIQEILSDLVEEWTGRPTTPPTGSTRSRRTSGRKSTRRTPALTSSDSDRTAS